ncbi:MAG: phenylalanine--tRNA ligase subunit beta [Deltaproteobacteria bacterium]|nr:phenylalanine--tRNA ligase subunit beta [Deltaproteobacteria bacterium]
MLFSYNWLKEYIENLPLPVELARALTMSGTEVESITASGAELNNVVTAEILSCAPHPNADRLQLCEVKTDAANYSIVCGARNMKAGDRVALALPGAELPGGIKIKKSKIRGVESQGMMCSEVELGIKDTSSGIMILPEDTPLGQDINTILNLKDYMMEVGITPNRADLLSIKGLSREIGAVTAAAFKAKEVKLIEGGMATDELVSVSIEDGSPCRRYSARVVEGVKIGPSPEALKARLEAHGIRSINNAVDVTNYVMLELGQPLHAFDFDKVEGKSIDVRLAGEGETIETIDSKVRNLDASMLVIADAKGPVALAGVMGGQATEVTDSTMNILLESAWFDPSSVRRTSKKTGLSSDSSYRFERGVDIEGVVAALDYAAFLIARLAGGTISKEALDVYTEPLSRREIRLRRERINGILGIEAEPSAVKSNLQRLGVEVSETGDGAYIAYAPLYRLDLKEEIDLIEEVARLFGYDNIPETLPNAPLRSGDPGNGTRLKRAIKDILSHSGFVEVLNYSFVSREMFSLTGPEDKDGIVISNPITEEQVVMRRSLIPSLIDTLRRNLLKKNEELRIFEVAPVFAPPSDPNEKLPVEVWRTAGLMYGPRWAETWNYPKEGLDFFDVKGVVEMLFEGLGITGSLNVGPITDHSKKIFHPGKSAAIIVNGKEAGVFGELHPELKIKFDLKRPAYLFDIEIDAIIDLAGGAKSYKPLPKFPESTRDIAFIIDENIPYQEIISSIRVLDTKLIERVELFDVYYPSNIPPGKRSLAIRAVYRSRERTLTSQEVDAMHAKVTEELIRKFNAEVRG